MSAWLPGWLPACLSACLPACWLDGWAFFLCFPFSLFFLFRFSDHLFFSSFCMCFYKFFPFFPFFPFFGLAFSGGPVELVGDDM